jgi:hypothetical protein
LKQRKALKSKGKEEGALVGERKRRRTQGTASGTSANANDGALKSDYTRNGVELRAFAPSANDFFRFFLTLALLERALPSMFLIF